MDENLPVAPEETVKQPVLENMAVWNLLRASSWMKFISILGFIGSGLFVLIGLIFMIGGEAFKQFNMPFLGQGGIFIFVFYLIMGIVTFFPPYYLFKYSNKLQEFGSAGNIQSLTEAFLYQKKYWKYLGVLTIIYLSIMVLGIIISLVSLAFV